MIASGHADVGTAPLPAFTNAGTLRKSTSDGTVNLLIGGRQIVPL